MIKCPYCGNDDFEIFDTIGGIDGEDMIQLCTCFECDKNFSIVYKFSHIEEDD